MSRCAARPDPGPPLAGRGRRDGPGLRRDPRGVRGPRGVPGRRAGRGRARGPREPPLPELDATDVPLVTLDPPGSRDLDQAVHLAARGDGYRVSYAIADVGAFVRLGGALDAEARRRGQTLYSPDRRTPLHPPVLSEGAASLLPGQLRPAVLWTIDLDADGEPVARRPAPGPGPQPRPAGLPVGPGAGRRRHAARAARAAAGDRRAAAAAGAPSAARSSSARPTRRSWPAPDGGWTLVLRGDLPVEGWNAQISLLTGRCAAGLMLDGGVGVLRTLPPARPEDVARLRLLAPGARRRLAGGRRPGRGHRRRSTPRRPGHAAFLEEAVALLRGAAYTPFDGDAAGAARARRRRRRRTRT